MSAMLMHTCPPQCPTPPTVSLNWSQADAIQLRLQGGAIRVWRVGPPTVTAHCSGIHSPPA